jgi:asparagine synthetase B (glutamine-hydrolysing)
MCSFVFTTKQLAESEIHACNTLLKYRGPDELIVTYNSVGTFIHNRLAITGNTRQPYSTEKYTVMLNGEIYNYCGDNELNFIINCYEKYGIDFAKYLDGEFSIILADHVKQRLFLSVDAFKTKPLWYALQNGIHASTYKSALQTLNIKNILPIKPNTTLVYDIKSCQFQEHINVIFDINQYKDTYTDIITALDVAIDKRSATDKKIFMGLSSGYDSGCIAARLYKTKKLAYYFAIENNECINTLSKRYKLLKNVCNINYSKKNNLNAQANLQKYCEYSHNTEYNFISDKSSLPLMHIGLLGKKENCKIFLSGTGSDEIIGDYYIQNSYNTDPSTCFKGVFPVNLTNIFPWKNFYNGTMRKYLTKDEYIIGCLGIETRYPFLDKMFVQEFLWLKPELKNAQYKAPLAEYLQQYNFPYSKNEKRGFSVR